MLFVCLSTCHQLPGSPQAHSRTKTRPLSLFIFTMLLSTNCCNGRVPRHIIFHGIWLFVYLGLQKILVDHPTDYNQINFTLQIHDAILSTNCCGCRESRQVIFQGLWLCLCHRLQWLLVHHPSNNNQTTFTLHIYDATVNFYNGKDSRQFILRGLCLSTCYGLPRSTID